MFFCRLVFALLHLKLKMTRLVVAVFLASLALIEASTSLPPLIKTFDGHFHELDPDYPFEITCESEAESKITWYKDNSKLEDLNLDGINIINVSGNENALSVENPDPWVHSGLYHCTAENYFGTAKSEVVRFGTEEKNIPETYYVPKVTNGPAAEYHSIGSSMSFTCTAEGNPAPAIIWYKNGVMMREHYQKSVIEIDPIGKDDVGVYACNATNEFGYAYKMGFLQILTEEPSFTESPRDRQVVLGQEVFLRCRAKGYPIPTISWTFDGETIDSDNVEINDDGALRIKRVSHADAGVYSCEAKNSEGKESVRGELVVIDKTSIREGPKNQKAQIRSKVVMNCVVDENPELKVKIFWKFHNKNLDFGGRFIKGDNNELIIEDLEESDAGEFTIN